MARAVIPKEIIIYADQDGIEPFTNWLDGLKDKQDLKRIQTRLLRLEQGNYGDYKSLKDGVLELRLMFGSGYRVYFGEDGNKLVVLLIGGDKSLKRKILNKLKPIGRSIKNHE